MRDDQDGEGGSGFLGGLLLGAVIGAGVALLFAPESGRETRRKLGRRLQQLRDQAGEEAQGLGADLERRGRRIKRGVARAAAAARDELDDVI